MGLFSCCFAPEPATKYAIEDEPAPVSAVKYQPSPAPSAQREPLQVAAELEAAAQQFAKVPSDRDVEEPSSDIAAYHPYDDMPDAASEAVRARTPQDNVLAEEQPDAPASAQDTDYPVQEQQELAEEVNDAPLAAVMLVNGSDAASKRVDDASQGSTDAAPRAAAAAAAAITPHKATAGSYTTPQKDAVSKRRPAIPTPDRTPGSTNKTTPAKTPTARSASKTQQKQQPQKQSPAPSSATRPRSASKAAAVPAGDSPSVARPTKASLARAEASSRSLTAASPSAANGWKY